MSNPTHHTCSTCGHTWRHGQHGGHSCATLMAVTIAEQARELAALKAQPRGVVPSGWRIDREGDRIVVQGPYGGYAAERQGQSGIAESILYCLADAMLGLNSSPVSGSDARKLSDIGNELHNLSCHVVHHNESWANQLGALASELWYWSASSGAADERAAFEVWAKSTLQGCQLRYVRDALPKDDPRYGEYVSEALRLSWEGWQARAALSAAPDRSEQVRGVVQEGYVLVPERMHLSHKAIESITAHCGDGQEDAGYGPYSDGVLWVGEIEEEDGTKTYGLHIATADYPEEGSTTLVEFAAPSPACQKEGGSDEAAH